MEADSIDVTITVTNADEAGTVSLSAPPQVDTAVTASLTDPDGGVLGLAWTWDRSSNGTTWNAISEATLASYTPVADDSGYFLRATAAYRDGEGANKTAVSDPTERVQAAPTNAPPSFPTSETGQRTVAESVGAGVAVGLPVAASDTDGDALTYAKSGADAAAFDLDDDTGQLRTKAALDFETKASYAVTVSVHDGKDTDFAPDTSVDDTIDVTITVTNADEAGTVSPIGAAAGGHSGDGEPDGPGRGRGRANVDVGPIVERHDVERYQRGDAGELHAGRGRFGLFSAGHGGVQGWRGGEQDGRLGSDRAGASGADQRTAQLPDERDGAADGGGERGRGSRGRAPRGGQ